MDTISKFRRFASPYYLANAATVASYAWLRHRESLNDFEPFLKPAQVDFWERRALLMLAVLSTYRYVKKPKVDAFVADMLLYFKLAAVALTFAQDPYHGAALSAACALAFLLFPLPAYRGPSTVQELTPASFRQEVQQQGKGACAWVIQLYAPWSAECAHSDALVAEMSLRYATPGLQFGRLDVSRWPSMANRLRVTADSASRQLPTLILFVGGMESKRLPALKANGEAVNEAVQKKLLIQRFELDALYATHMQKGTS